MRFDWRESGCQALSELQQHLVVGEGEASQGKTGWWSDQRRMLQASAPVPAAAAAAVRGG